MSSNLERAAVIMVLLVMVVTRAAGDEQPASGPKPRPRWWGPVDAQWIFSLGAMNEGGSEVGTVHSTRFSIGLWDTRRYDLNDPPTHIDGWVSYGSRDDEHLTRVGANYGVFGPSWGPFRGDIHLRSGIEHGHFGRHDGWGLLAAAGLDLGLWVHQEWQLGFQLNRTSRASGGAWNDVCLEVRYSPRRLSQRH